MADDEGDAARPRRAASLRAPLPDRRGQDGPPAQALVQPPRSKNDDEKLKREKLRLLRVLLLIVDNSKLEKDVLAPAPAPEPITAPAPEPNWLTLLQTFEQLGFPRLSQAKE